ncbi:hypothetical protein A2954_03005 [Candidatus Roizmanbacteria bacterium RIFCSPLOWO2_01_FULL_37_12]|uniref:Peptidase M20 dimerisation domain-containing protein n=1 Tax=Candidatus Roizmanbacteria bacterium RIFCSPLOWO2_01_FULL_37_12 TaxID=1802056 RepID=A0A1F7IAH1_9BACT|nr:MAG: hypothetical protein A3D76_04335 [Candidatus Roizmanbacteria bacterium RIFCSPHIGHO2_02_FULL_37_9b]OGK40346.1 MAG: hypothetical protein A2954_03005 [Candidatus Roizmanbacteria bacterium RIFCSPLOWO2_01_FULL_37_12]
MKKIIALARRYIAIKSVGDNKSDLNRAISFCKKLIPKYKNLVLKEYEFNGKKSLVISYKGIKNATVMLHGHIDVVPGSGDSFVLKRTGDKLIGRGVYDMKITVLIFCKILGELSESVLKKIGVMIVTDEEIGGENGTKRLCKYYKPKFFLTGEPTNLTIFTQAKGALWVEIVQKGKAAHSGGPWLGKNAIELMNKNIVKLLQKRPNPKKYEWKTTFNLSQISGGSYINSVADSCILKVDVRYLPNASVKSILKFLKKTFIGAQIKVLRNNSPTINNENNFYIKKLSETFENVAKIKNRFGKNLGFTDARYYSALGIPAVSFGPLGGDAHSEKEWVSLKSVRLYEKVLINFLNSIVPE